ncbi:MAG: aspartate aminotransferase family protein [Candidatus Sumerlaeaceae bacterium]|nr:aspartate aminotransferase family protein [Candidatus Sumerlaeaceae bacterium]
MNAKQTRSEEIFQRALKVLPGGASRNAVIRKPHPCYAAVAQGCVVTDVEGNRRIDFANNMASLIHGHAHPAIVAAVTAQLPRGTAYNFATEIEVEYAEHLVSRSESFEKIRFVNSGTEAVMCSLKAARAFTQRPKMAKVEGAYHGVYDYAEVSQTAQPANWGDETHPVSVPVTRGTPRGVLDDVVIIPFNDTERALALLNEHRDDLACVLVDPLPHRVGMAPADPEFIAALRQWTRDNGALLVFDEVITFRSAYGGAQQWYKDRPDLTAMGKIIGGGFPVGALAGRADVMNVFDPFAPNVLFPHSGTFSANPVTMTAGLTAMRLFDHAAVNHVNSLCDRARRQIADAIREADIPACVTGGGSMFRIHMKPHVPRNYRESHPTPAEAQMLKTLLDYTFENGIMMIGTCSGTISTPMTTAEIDRLTEVLYAGFQKAREALPRVAARA